MTCAVSDSLGRMAGALSFWLRLNPAAFPEPGRGLNGLDSWAERVYGILMVVTSEVGAKPLADLVKQVLAGNEVLLTQGDQPVARLVPACNVEAGNAVPLLVRSLTGHRVLTPNITQEDLAEELFGPQ